jgi:predicted Zn-dependent peptidase
MSYPQTSVATDKTTSTHYTVPIIAQQTLDNGLRVVVIPKMTAPVVSVAVSYSVGSYDESPANTGFAHLFEHLMFEGSENVAHGMFDKYCSQAGGENNAYTTYDKTTYYMTLPAHQLELGLWLEADRMRAFGITQDVLDVQKNVVLEEINQNVENQPYGRFSRVQNRLAFAPESGYHWDVYGNPEHIAASTLDNVRQFFTTFYRPDNACLVMCGAVEPSSALALAEKHFGSIARGAAFGDPAISRRTFAAEHRQRGGRSERMEDAIPTNTLFLAFHGEGFLHEHDTHTAEVLCSILSDGISSRLYKHLAYEQQIASEINAYVDDRQFTSLFNIYAIANALPGEHEISCDALYDSIQDVLQAVSRDGVTTQEVQKARNRITTRHARALQRVGGIADEAAHQTLFFGNPERVFSLLDGFNAVTPDDVHALAQRLFVTDNEIRVDVIPTLH